MKSYLHKLNNIHEELKEEEEKMIMTAYTMTTMVCKRHDVCDDCPLRSDGGPCIVDDLANVVVKEVPWRL